MSTQLTRIAGIRSIAPVAAASTVRRAAIAKRKLALQRLAEFAVLAVIQIVPTYFVHGIPGLPTASPFPWTIVAWLVYLTLSQRHLTSIPKPVALIALANLLGAAGYMSSGLIVDLVSPIHQGLFCLAVAGVFARKAARESQIHLIAAASTILIALATYASIVRNEISIFPLGGSRFGFSLVGWFAAVLFSAVMALPGRWRLLGALPVLLVVRSGSRAAMVAVCLQLGVMYLLTNQRTVNWRRVFLAVLAVVALVIAIPSPEATIEDTIRIRVAQSPEDWDRLSDFRGARTVGWSLAWDLLQERPSLLGHGIDTYDWRLGYGFGPHNGILHVFNGYGIIPGFLYLWGCISLFVTLVRPRPPFSPVIIWSLGLFMLQFSHGFFEATTVLEGTVHVVALFAAYGIGVGLQHARLRPKQRPAVGTGLVMPWKPQPTLRRGGTSVV